MLKCVFMPSQSRRHHLLPKNQTKIHSSRVNLMISVILGGKFLDDPFIDIGIIFGDERGGDTLDLTGWKIDR